MIKVRPAGNVQAKQEALQQRREDYDVYRQRMQHEDTLIGQRINWLVSSQAFLLSPYVFLFLKQFDIVSSSNPHHFAPWKVSVFTDVLAIVICLIGFRCCYRVGKSLAAAELSMDRLTYAWILMYDKTDRFEPDIAMQRKEARKGISAPYGLVQSFTKAWSVLMCLSAASPLVTVIPNVMLVLWIAVALGGLYLGNRLCVFFFNDDHKEIEAVNAMIRALETTREQERTAAIR